MDDHKEPHEHPKHGLPGLIGRWISIRTRARFLLLFFALAFILVTYRRFFLLAILMVIVMAWDAFQHYIHIPIHLDFLPFVSLFVTAEYGIAISLPFMLISGILPELIVGHFELGDSLSILPILIINFALASQLHNNFIPWAYIAAFIFMLCEIVIAFAAMEPPHKRFLEPLAVFSISALFIWRITPLLFFIA